MSGSDWSIVRPIKATPELERPPAESAGWVGRLQEKVLINDLGTLVAEYSHADGSLPVDRGKDDSQFSILDETTIERPREGVRYANSTNE